MSFRRRAATVEIRISIVQFLSIITVEIETFEEKIVTSAYGLLAMTGFFASLTAILAERSF